MIDISQLDPAKVKEYAAAAGKIAGAIEGLKRHDGWQIFLALYKRKKDELKESDFDTLEDFKGARKACEIVESIFEEMETYIEDAEGAAKALMGISEEEGGKERGIMLIEAAEDVNREG